MKCWWCQKRKRIKGKDTLFCRKCLNLKKPLNGANQRGYRTK